MLCPACKRRACRPWTSASAPTADRATRMAPASRNGTDGSRHQRMQAVRTSAAALVCRAPIPTLSDTTSELRRRQSALVTLFHARCPDRAQQHELEGVLLAAAVELGDLLGPRTEYTQSERYTSQPVGGITGACHASGPLSFELADAPQHRIYS